MAPAMSATRRPRSSVTLANDFFNEGSSQPVVDVEFRRKHSRQNKEIIAENVRHKTAMKVLNEEIGSLQAELMEVKQINRILSLQMKKVKEDQAKFNSTSAIHAVDALIAAMPALQALRQVMVPTAAALPVFEGEVARRNLLRNIGMTIATRPGVSGAASSTLECLGEEEEDTQHETPSRVRKTTSSRLASTSHIAGELSILNRRSNASPISQVIPRSPIPHGPRTAVIPPTFVVESPAPSTSPSPMRRVSASPKRKARRRRESGLLPTLPTNTSQLDLGLQEEATASSSSLSSVQDVSQSIGTSSDISSALTCLSELSSTEGGSASFDDDGKRGRRSRASVNYKEPSLTKKMRKPDGVPVAEMLAHRQMLHDSLLPPVRGPSGMRRKSVLPPTLSSTTAPESNRDSDNDDVDDIDDCLDVPDQVWSIGSPRDTNTLSSWTGSPLSEASSAPSSSNTGDHEKSNGFASRQSPITPTEEEDQTSQEPKTVDIEPRRAPSIATQPKHISPRKVNADPNILRAKPRRSTLVGTRPGERLSSRASRSALSDVPEPNYEPKSISELMSAKAAAQAALSKPRPATAARR